MEQELVTETITRTVDLKPLRMRLRELQDMTEPTNKELIAIGKEHHEFYTNRDNEILNIKAEIKRLKG